MSEMSELEIEFNKAVRENLVMKYYLSYILFINKLLGHAQYMIQLIV